MTLRCDERNDGVAVLTLDRPEARNALSAELRQALREALERLAGERSVRAVVLTGAGDRAFASGADLDELRDAMTSAAGAAAYDARVAALYRALRRSPLPVVARIGGHAIGGGFLLALACDLRVAAADVTVGLPVSRIGLMLSPAEHERLVGQIGPSRARIFRTMDTYSRVLTRGFPNGTPCHPSATCGPETPSPSMNRPPER